MNEHTWNQNINITQEPAVPVAAQAADHVPITVPVTVPVTLPTAAPSTQGAARATDHVPITVPVTVPITLPTTAAVAPAKTHAVGLGKVLAIIAGVFFLVGAGFFLITAIIE